MLVIQCSRYDVVNTAPLLAEAVQHSCHAEQYLDPRKRVHSSPNKYRNNMPIAVRIKETRNTAEHKDIFTALMTRAFQAMFDTCQRLTDAWHAFPVHGPE